MTIEMIDRVALILKPSETMLTWINENPDNEEKLSLEEVQADCTVVLLPVFGHEEAAENYLSHVFEELFENELASWNIDESSWPKDRTLEMFLMWFDLEFHPFVCDAARGLELSDEAEKSTLQ
jgi:hypothetical protein